MVDISEYFTQNALSKVPIQRIKKFVQQGRTIQRTIRSLTIFFRKLKFLPVAVLNVLSSTYLAVHIYATKHRPQNSPNFEKWNVLLVNCCKKIKQVPKKYMVKKIFVYSTSTEIRGFHTVK